MSRPRITINGLPYLGTHLPFDRLSKVGESFFVPKERKDPYNVKEGVRQRNKKGRGKFSYEQTWDGVMVTREPDESIT